MATAVAQRMYRWKLGMEWPVPAQVVGQRLEQLAERHKGEVKPEHVVDDASDPSSPLHPLFEWNDSEAARQYRLIQARQILRSIEVEVVVKESKPTTIRAFFRIVNSQDTGYRMTVSILSDEERRRLLVQQALQELAAFKRKYAMLHELASVFEAIDRAQAELSFEAA